MLFPNVGKTYRNTVLINGTHYPTSQHGFARDSRFKCICEKADSVSFLLASSEETKEVYPFEFELVITYTLKEKSLCVRWEVRNPGERRYVLYDRRTPCVQVCGKGREENGLYPEVPGKDSLRYILIDPAEAAADPAKVYTLDLDGECCPVTEECLKMTR